MSNILFLVNKEESTLLTPLNGLKYDTLIKQSKSTLPKVSKQENHTLINVDSLELLFPGELIQEKSHTVITTITSPYNFNYLKSDNALSEFNTPELKAKARYNLGVDNKTEWGEIKGEIAELEDLKELLLTNWIDVLN